MDVFEEFNDDKPTLEQSEDATYRTGKDFFRREKVLSYPYNSAEDFKELSPPTILTRRFKLINPDIDAGTAAKKILSEPQRQAVLRLMAIKKNVEAFPIEKQDKLRADLLYQTEQNQEKVEMLIDEMILELKVEDLNKQLSYDEDKRLQARLEQLRGYIPSEEELIKRVKILKKGLSPPSEAELRERLKNLKKKGGSKKTKKARRKAHRKGMKKSMRKSMKKSMRKSSRKSIKKVKKSRRLVKN